MNISDFSDQTSTNNQEIQVFIIKQVDRNDKEEFEEKYKQYLGEQNYFLNSKSSNFLNNLLYTTGRQNYLIPLIYDLPTFNKIKLTEKDIRDLDLYSFECLNKNVSISSDTYINNDEYNEIYTLNFNEEKRNDIDSEIWGIKKIQSIYYFEKYYYLLSCPLLNYTKLSYVYQIKNQNLQGIGNVVSVNTSFNINNSSNCSITFQDDGNDEIAKDMFSVNDIVIVKMLKSKNEINNEEDKYKCIFTGYIDNINYSIDWNSHNKNISIICTGPTKKMLFTRVITGQATCDIKDPSTVLNPISVYSCPQTIGENNKAPISSEDIVKNIVVRNFCDIDSNKEIKKIKLKIEYYFKHNAEFKQDLTIYAGNLANLKNQYVSLISVYLNRFLHEHADGITRIYNNIRTFIKLDLKNTQFGLAGIYNLKKMTQEYQQQLPIMQINGTTQPAYQQIFNNFKDIFISQYDTLFQFIKKIANSFEFCFYDDPDGIIHFEVIDTSLNHLYKFDNANNLKNIISFGENQNTNEIYNIISLSGCGTIQSMPDTTTWGEHSLVIDNNLIKQVGERYLNGGCITGLNTETAMNIYAQGLMSRNNRKAMSDINVRLIGDPSITMAKYAYIKELQKLFYINSIKHTWNAGSTYTVDITGYYTREKIISLKDICNENYEDTFNIKDIPKNRTSEGRFRYATQYIDNLLDKNNTTENINEILGKKNLYDKIENILKKKFNYIGDKILEEVYGGDDKKYIYTYLNGYFWINPVINNLYELSKTNDKKFIVEDTIAKEIGVKK